MGDGKEKSIEERKLDLKEKELALKKAELETRYWEAYYGSRARTDHTCQSEDESKRRETDWTDVLVGGAIGLGIGSLFDDD